MRKSLRRIIIPVFGLLLSLTSLTNVAAEPRPVITLQVFYDELLPYGQWIQDETYGYVWLPYEERFRPYFTQGYWALTAYGNTWNSYYPWGWAVFHYGRWTYNSYYGWIWIPGYEWGPAWVCWRADADKYGWAPLSPGADAAAAARSYECPANWWVFVKQYYLYRTRTDALYDASGNGPILATTYIMGNTYTDHSKEVVYLTGPTVDEVCRIKADEICETTGQQVTVYKIRNSPLPRQIVTRNFTIQMFRPDVRPYPKKPPVPGSFKKAPQPVGPPEPVNTDPAHHAPFRDAMDPELHRSIGG